MPSGLIALLDDVAAIARAAAASLDDVAAGVAKAGGKAVGVVVDDAAVTPAYVAAFTPDRELPIIWRITKGSLRNKLLILLPAALALSVLAPWAITPLLMLGGLYLSFEGAEKTIEALGGARHGATLDDPVADAAAFENARVTGAVRTDLILSAEIMAIALAEVTDEPLLERAVVLALVGVAITVAVYGAVAMIVKMDDVGLHLARRGGAGARWLGRGLLGAMPLVLAALSRVGTVAMLWVGGGILLHGAEELGWPAPAHLAHAAAHAAAATTGAAGGVLGWLTYAACAAAAGLAAGMAAAGAAQLARTARGGRH